MTDRIDLLAGPAAASVRGRRIVPSLLLRRALQADAVASAASGLAMFLGAAVLDGPTGLPTALLRYAGLALLPYAALVGWMGLRPYLPRWAVWAVILGNMAWAADSALLLVSGWVQPTGFGIAFALAQALVVAVLAELQFFGLRRSAAI